MKIMLEFPEVPIEDDFKFIVGVMMSSLNSKKDGIYFDITNAFTTLFSEYNKLEVLPKEISVATEIETQN